MLRVSYPSYSTDSNSSSTTSAPRKHVEFAPTVPTSSSYTMPAKTRSSGFHLHYPRSREYNNNDSPFKQDHPHQTNGGAADGGLCQVRRTYGDSNGEAAPSKYVMEISVMTRMRSGSESCRYHSFLTSKETRTEYQLNPFRVRCRMIVLVFRVD